MASLISSIGVMVSFYYGMTGLACAWYYRRVLRRSWKILWIRGIYPIASAIFLLIVGLVQLPQLGWSVSLLTIGAIAIGLLPMLYFRAKYGSTFYSDPPEFQNPNLEGGLVEVGG
jgi:hypothetical protein